MIADLIDSMTSLTTLMEEESEKLARGARVPDLPEIAEAKLRLAGRIEAGMTRLARQNSGWMEDMAEDERARLAEVVRHLRDASTVNAQVLSRQIELSGEMMAAIAAEAKRLSGTRSETYGAWGGLSGVDVPAPISINARL